MAMRESTRQAIELLREKIGERVFSEHEVEGVSLQTLMRYDFVKRVELRDEEELSLQEVVELLNEMEGKDCWYDRSEGYIEYELRDGRVYRVDVSYGYRFVA